MNEMLATLAALLIMTVPLAHADETGYEHPQAQRQTAAAAVVDINLREGVGKLIDFIEQMRLQGRNLTPDSTAAFLDREITPYFDFAYMARWAGGPLYPQLSDEQRFQLQEKLKRLFYTTLASHLGTYRSQEIRYFSPRPARNGREITMTAWIVQPHALPTKLVFRFYRSEGQWKVFDVVANRTSAILYYRQLFTRMLRRYGAGWLTT